MQHPVPGFSPPNPANPDTEAAMKAAQTHAAIATNEKAFPVFAKKLASRDPREYANTARKLTDWLASEKAYYPGARPKIVELLEIAHSAFRNTFVNHSSAPDFAQLLRKLLQTVAPFIHLFSEAELHSRVQQVMVEANWSLSRVATSSTQASVTSQVTATANLTTTSVPLLPLSSPFNAQSQVSMPLAAGPQKSLSHAHFSLDTAKAVSDHPGHIDAPRARNPAEEVTRQTDASMPLTASLTRAPQQLGENLSPSLPSKPQPTRARAAKLSEELIARDLVWFKSNQAPAAVSMEPSSPLFRADESSPALVSDAADIPGRSPSPNKKTARIIPSRHLPRRISSGAPERMESSASSVELPSTSESLVEEAKSLENEDGSVLNVDAQQSLLERTEQSTAMPETPDMQKVSLHEELSASRALASSSNEPPTKPELSLADYQTQPSKAPLDESVPPHGPSTPLPDTTSDSVASMDISVPGSERVVSESPRKIVSFLPQSPQALRFQSPMLPPPVGAWQPPLNLDFKIPPARLATDANHQRFGDEMAIFHVMQLETFTRTCMIEFNLTESMFSKISKWLNRKSAPSKAPHGVCLSLACYCLAELFGKIKLGNDKPDLRTLTSQIPCSWPHSNSLSLHVTCETRQTIVALSPPLFLTPNQCVDITSLIRLGHNTLEIKQRGDLSQYLIVLHAHRPTREQLAELGVMKTVDERWQRFLGVLSAQAVQGETLGTTPAGVSGVF